MRPILFLTDLDHNLFQSLRVDSGGRYPMTVNKTGVAHCYANPAQFALFNLMKDNAFCVAVTARTPEQMMRVSGWQTRQRHDLALTDLGLTLLHRVDEGPWEAISAWSTPYLAEARARSVIVQADFSVFQDTLVELAAAGDASKLSFSLNFCHEDPEVPFYFLVQVVDKNPANSPNASDVRAACALFNNESQGDYTYHESEGTFAFWPTFVGKQQAVERLLALFDSGLDDARFEAARQEKGAVDLVLSSGDSLSDLSFMKSAHFWMAPSDSQISNLVLPTNLSVFTPHQYEG